MRDIPDSEIEITVSEEDGYFIARAFHRPTMTLKISDKSEIREQVIDTVKAEIKQLIQQRLQGLTGS